MAANSQNGFENYVQTLIASGTIDSTYLAHVGNENSGRYPRGSGGRPWQHVAAALRARLTGKKDKQKIAGSNPGQGGTGSVNGAHAAQQPHPSSPAPAKPAATSKYQYDEMSARKRAMLTRADPKEILKNQEMFTTNELNDALVRYDKLNQLNNKIPREKTIVDKIDSVFGTINKANSWIQTGMNVAKTAKQIQDLTNPQKKKEISYGQAYAMQFLRTLNGKKFAELDPKEVNSAVNVLNNLEKISDMATGKNKKNNNQNNNNGGDKKK